MADDVHALKHYVQKLIADLAPAMAHMAQEQVSTLLGVPEEIKKLDDNMESFKAFLADAERRRLTDQSVQRWVRKLKDAMYDATDILDLCQLEADNRRECTEGGSSVEENVSAGCFQPLFLCLRNAENLSPGCFKPLFFCLQNPKFAYRIGCQIKELNQRLEDIHKQAQKFKFIDLGSYPERRVSSQKMRSEISEIDDSAIVGEKIEQETGKLAKMLITGDSHDIRVVSIVGTGGMGKTTLAQKIFNETTIQEHFKVKVWLSITQHFDEVEMLRTSIKHAGGHHGDEHDKTLLTRILTNTLSTGRFLFVLDDVWSDNVWSHVLSVPIKNASQKQSGNWVLVTTRFRDMAQRLGALFYEHNVSPLNEEDAWSLLNKQLPQSPTQVLGTDHLRDVGMKIIRKCGGLPLAVKVMGGLLRTRSRSEHEWEAVLNHRAWSVDGLPEELDTRIYLSYEDMSAQLKQCFLYCSLFPKGNTIRQAEVVPMWIAEGFIQPQSGRNSHDDRLEEIATDYYKELITRNLIEATDITRYWCTMHDVVRSFAEFMAREDSLVVVQLDSRRQVAGGSNSNDDSSLVVRHMAVGPSKLVPEWAVLRKQESSLRTLIIHCKINFGPHDSLASFSRLRVLSIKGGGDCDRLVGSLCELRHLRYICLEETNISRLPDDIHRMKFLQHILIRQSRNLENLPSSIKKLAHLRTLNMKGSNINVTIPKGFGVLENLRVLFGFPVHTDTDGGWCSLEEIGPLSQLRDLSLHGLENVPASSLAEKATLSCKEHLDYLELVWSSSGWMGLRDEMEKQQRQHAVEEVLEKLCPPPSVQHLVIQGYFGRILPNWMTVPATGAYKSLMILKLEDLPCCAKLPDGLCRLPSLKALAIVDAPAVKSVGSEFHASSSSTSATFPNLTTLHLEGLCEWEQWDWEDVTTAHVMAMPALVGLTIDNCKLSCLPPGLASIKRHALRRLSLFKLTNLTAVENFRSVMELDVFDCPELKEISGLSRLHKIRIVCCPKLEELEDVPSLDSLLLEDITMEALPGYLQAVNPRYIEVDCSKKLCESLLSPGSSEWNKISHIGKRNIINMED